MNSLDLAVLTASFFSTPERVQWNADADFDGDATVNFTDLAIMKTFMFLPPGPSGVPNDCD